jgi:hypothetical protein
MSFATRVIDFFVDDSGRIITEILNERCHGEIVSADSASGREVISCL